MSSGFLVPGAIGPVAIGGSGELADPVPVLGAEALVNGGFETWLSATNVASWDDYPLGTTTHNQDSAEQRSGNYCLRYDIDASNSRGFVRQNLAGGAGWYELSGFAKGTSGAGAQPILGDAYTTISLTMSWLGFLLAGRVSASNAWVDLWRYNSASKSIYFDDVSCKPLTLSSLFSARAYASADCDLSAAITRTSGTQAGLCARLDSASSPANFLIAYLDGAGNVKVDKCVAGTYTNVISGAVTYAAGRVLRLVCSGNSVSAYYNGTQVGTTQTVSDAGIVSNVRHGKFSTYAANTMTGFVAA